MTSFMQQLKLLTDPAVQLVALKDHLAVPGNHSLMLLPEYQRWVEAHSDLVIASSTIEGYKGLY